MSNPAGGTYFSLCLPYGLGLLPVLIACRSWAQNPGIALEVRAMADVVYLVIGVLFFVLMGVYAVACDRL